MDNPNFQSFQDVYDEIISWLPADLQAARNLTFDGAGNLDFRENPGETPTRSFISKGFELDLTANITDNWRLFLNAAQQKASQSNIATDVLELYEEVLANIRASEIGQWADTPQLGRNEGATFESRLIANVGLGLTRQTANEGQNTLEMREWRVNAVTSYSFTEGALEGLTLGGGVRWQDENALGYPNILGENDVVLPDLANPFMGPDQLNGDLWISYAKRLKNRIDWKVQLNFRNAVGDSDYIPALINPDGRIAVVRNPQPREVFLTNTFSF